MKDDLVFILHITNNPFVSYYKCKLIIPLKLYKTLQRFNLNKLMQPIKLNVITACLFVFVSPHQTQNLEMDNKQNTRYLLCFVFEIAIISTAIYLSVKKKKDFEQKGIIVVARHRTDDRQLQSAVQQWVITPWYNDVVMITSPIIWSQHGGFGLWIPAINQYSA